MKEPKAIEITKLVEQLLAGDQRSLSRALSLLEAGGSAGADLLRQIYPHRKATRVIGVTGPPGAGKSTLTDRLALQLHALGKKVAILAIDPSSPLTGGALLGDRIRMVGASERSDIFIRSMSSRGALGGLAPRTREVIYALDAAGYDFVLLETVGVGQGEIEVVRAADTVIVVVVPGMGDGVQALKAGILEIADLFAINKADYEGVERLEKELITLLGLVPAKGWTPSITRTIATTGEGIAPLITAIDSHKSWSDLSGEFAARRQRFAAEDLKNRVVAILAANLFSDPHFQTRLSSELALLASNATNPAESATRLAQNPVHKPRKQRTT